MTTFFACTPKGKDWGALVWGVGESEDEARTDACEMFDDETDAEECDVYEASEAAVKLVNFQGGDAALVIRDDRVITMEEDAKLDAEQEATRQQEIAASPALTPREAGVEVAFGANTEERASLAIEPIMRRYKGRLYWYGQTLFCEPKWLEFGRERG